MAHGDHLGEAIGDHRWASLASRLSTKICDNDVTGSFEALGPHLVIIELFGDLGDPAHEALWSSRGASEACEGDELDVVSEVGVSAGVWVLKRRREEGPHDLHVLL